MKECDILGESGQHTLTPFYTFSAGSVPPPTPVIYDPARGAASMRVIAPSPTLGLLVPVFRSRCA